MIHSSHLARLFGAFLCAGLALSGCKRKQEPDAAEQRKALLTPRDQRQDREEFARKTQVFASDGDLLPSDQVVAGVVLPRGLALVSSFPHEWTYHANHVPAPALERYFNARLITNNLTHSVDGAVGIDMARVKDDPNAPPVTLRIYRLRGELDASEVHIRQAVPGTPGKTEAQVQAEMAAKRAHAD